MFQEESISSRFCRYVQIDTQSDPESTSVPSTEKQKDLSRILVQELLQMGLKDAHLDEFGYVYATLESNVDADVPVAEAGPGALVLFRMRRGAIAKHIGILTGPASGPASFRIPTRGWAWSRNL
jgi:di/tripeptidase